MTVELANTYVVCDGATCEAWLVDVGEMSERLLAWVDSCGLKVTGLFITHAHHDHNGAVEAYRSHFPSVPVYGGSAACAAGCTTVVADGQKLRLGQEDAGVLATPGHTPEHVMLYFPDGGVLFSGDALFAGSVGGTFTQSAREQQIDVIRRKVLTLPADVRIYPGHGPMTTVRVEREGNPFFR